jgi:hypothetical protein
MLTEVPGGPSVVVSHIDIWDCALARVGINAVEVRINSAIRISFVFLLFFWNFIEYSRSLPY